MQEVLRKALQFKLVKVQKLIINSSRLFNEQGLCMDRPQI